MTAVYKRHTQAPFEEKTRFLGKPKVVHMVLCQQGKALTGHQPGRWHSAFIDHTVGPAPGDAKKAKSA
jgi:hypothetical protein